MELDMNLLSSMSPKLKKNHKLPVRKAPTKLALKSHFRRSSLLHVKLHHKNETIISISSESTSTTTTMESNSGKSSLKLNKIPEVLLISDNESKIIVESPLIQKTPIIRPKSPKFGELSAEKVSDIQSWLENCQNENENLEESLNKLIIDDSFELNLDESLKTRLNTKKPENQSTPRPIQDQKDDDFSSLLDSLYGNSWRDREVEILPASEPKIKNNAPKPAKKAPQTEKVKKTTNIYSDKKTNKTNRLLENLQRTRIKKALESPWQPTDELPTVQNKKLLPMKLDFQENESDTNKLDLSLSWLKSSNENSPKIKSNTISKNNSYSTYDSSATTEKTKNKKVPNLNKNDLKTKSKYSSGRGSVNSCDDSSSSSSANIIIKTKKLPKTATPRFAKPKQKRLYFIDSDESDNDLGTTDSSTNPKSKSIDLTNKKWTFLASLSKHVPILETEMSARIYRNNFQRYRDELVKKLFDLYNANIFDNRIPADTPIVWNERMRGTAGYCYSRKVTHRSGEVEHAVRIALATKVLDSADRLRDTLVHEMCHAATWIVNGLSDGHGVFWRTWADKAMAAFPELPPIKRCHQYEISTKYTYRCKECGYSVGRHSKSLNLERKCCGYCRGRFELFLNKVNKNGDKKMVLSTPKKPSGFAIFVKENYAIYKQPDIKHGDVMKILGQKFSELKVTK